jgi:hypothetical protein
LVLNLPASGTQWVLMLLRLMEKPWPPRMLVSPQGAESQVKGPCDHASPYSRT